MSTPRPLGITNQDYTAGLSEDNLGSHTGDKTGHDRFGKIVRSMPNFSRPKIN
jgi:hypothetical protein